MTNLAGEYLGKMMTWKEMKENFPDLWVFVTDYEVKGNIIRGVLIGVFTDDERDKFYIECLHKGIDVERQRTTEVPGNFFLGGY